MAIEEEERMKAYPMNVRIAFFSFASYLVKFSLPSKNKDNGRDVHMVRAGGMGTNDQ